MSFETVMPPFGSADPNASFLSSSCLDFLLIELVPLAYRVTQELDTAALSAAAAMGGAANLSETGAGSITATATSPPPSNGGDSATAAAASAGGSRKMDEDEEREAVFYRLERLGYRVGQGLIERYVHPSMTPGPPPSLPHLMTRWLIGFL